MAYVRRRMSRAGVASQRGFTLIEVMIAVLILLVGMLGVVGMQMLSLQANQGAYFRSQAVYIGSEILDAMRANPTVAVNYAGTFPENGGANTVPADQGCDAGAIGCTPNQRALQDLREWNGHFVDVVGVGAANFRPSIPNGRAVITADAANSEFTVQVFWTERQFDNDAGDGALLRSNVEQAVTLTTVLTP